MKPGYQTSEFWVALLSQALAFLVAAHLLGAQDQHDLAAALTNAVTAACTLLASARVVLHYIESRTLLKKQAGASVSVAAAAALPAPTRPPAAALAILVAVAMGFLAAPAPAQTPTSLLPWRDRIERELRELRQDRAGRGGELNSAVVGLLQQIVEQQRELLQLLKDQHEHLRQQDAGQPRLIVLGQPLQQIPLGGPALQQIPLGGSPLQQIPLGTPPRQDIPLGGPRGQDIPLGGYPRQQLDVPPSAPFSPRPDALPKAPAAPVQPKLPLPIDLGPPPSSLLPPTVPSSWRWRPGSAR